MSKIFLKLDEANDLNFQFRVQGTSSEPGASAPQFRFLVTEKENPEAVGFIFPVTAKESNGTITVTVPALNEMVKENTAYVGKVEVLVGSRLLTPTILEVEFTRSLSIEVIPMLPESHVDDRVTPEDMIADLEERSSGTVAEVGKKQQITLTKSQLQKLIQERAAQKRKAAEPVKVGSPLKNSLKSMMKDALED
jgi:hypothetical protein